LKRKKFGFIKPTIIFSVIGIFIPGFTAIGILGIQMLLTSIGIECSNAWNGIWIFSILSSIILPLFFYLHIQKINQDKLRNLKIYLNLFNIFEYFLIQASLSAFFTTGEILCYGSGGQNGIELAFSAWLAIPILICFSFIFSKRLNKKIERENSTE
jgi:hypothetical protein